MIYCLKRSSSPAQATQQQTHQRLHQLAEQTTVEQAHQQIMLVS